MRLTLARLASVCAVVLLLVASPSVAIAQGTAEAEVRNTVEQFCAWDFEGARLTSRNAHFMDAAGLLYGSTAWPEEPIDIISSYRVAAVRAKGERGRAAVQYSVLAEIRGGLERRGMEISRRQQTVWLRVTRVDAHWKIDAAELSPHVSVNAMRSHIAQIRQDDQEAGDHHREEILGDLMAQIEKLGPAPGTSRDLKPGPNQN